MLMLRITKQKINQTWFSLLLRSLLLSISTVYSPFIEAGISDDELGTKHTFNESSETSIEHFSGTTRWDHNLILLTGNARGSWVIDHLGPTRGETFSSNAFYFKFQYAFHLPIVGNLGYVLGSSFGYYWEEKGPSSTFQKTSSIHFPGIHLGVVYNFTSSFRIEFAGETYLERLNDLSIISNGERYKISVTMRPNYDFSLASDLFYSTKWGVRLEWHTREVQAHPPSDSQGQIIGAGLIKKDTWFGLGVIYHLFAS